MLSHFYVHGFNLSICTALEINDMLYQRIIIDQYILDKKVRDTQIKYISHVIYNRKQNTRITSAFIFKV